MILGRPSAWNRITGIKGIRVFDVLSESHEAWKEYRYNGIGSSDISTVANENPWKAALQLWMEKTHIADDETIENDSMYWGKILEDIVAREFGKRSPFKVQKINSILQHPEVKFHLASPDRLLLPKKPNLFESNEFEIPDFVEGPGMLEVKTVNKDVYYSHWNRYLPPVYVIAQNLWQQYVSGTKWGAIAMLCGKDIYRQWYIKYDEKKIAEYIKLANEFWQCVQTETMPDIDGHKKTREALSQYYSKPSRNLIELPVEAEEHFLNYHYAHSEIQKLTVMKTLATNNLCKMVGDNERGILGGASILWTIKSDGNRTPYINNPERAIA